MIAQELDTFATEARAFLAQHVPARAPTRRQGWGEGPDEVSATGGAEVDDDAHRARSQAWRATLFDAGYGWLTGPRQYGGAALDAAFEERFAGIEAEFDTPDQSLFQVARGMVSPAVLAHGSEHLKQRFLPGIHRGDVICCQLLSEPEAGSDLAGLRTRAVRDGDEWIVNGQKVWSSYAHVASVGQLLARTDPDVPKHQGLTMFLLPMDSPGVEVRPLRQMNGQAHFNEVFLNDVRVPDANRVGEPGEGWRAVLTTLMNERHVVAGGTGSGLDGPARVQELARHLGRTGDPVVRHRFADVVVHEKLLHYLHLRQAAAAQRGRAPGP